MPFNNYFRTNFVWKELFILETIFLSDGTLKNMFYMIENKYTLDIRLGS